MREIKAPDQVLVDSLRLTMEMVIDEVESAYEVDDPANSRWELESTDNEDEWSVMKKRDFLQSVIDSIEDSILIIDLAYRVRMMNRHAHELHIGSDSPPEPLYCYQMSHDRTSPCSGKDHPCPLEEVLRTGTSARTTHMHHDRHGNQFKVAILASPLLSDDNEIVGIIESTFRLPS